MKKVLKGLLLGGAVSMSVVIGCERARQVLLQRRDQNAVRSLRNAYMLSVTQQSTRGECLQMRGTDKEAVQQVGVQVTTKTELVHPQMTEIHLSPSITPLPVLDITRKVDTLKVSLS